MHPIENERFPLAAGISQTLSGKLFLSVSPMISDTAVSNYNVALGSFRHFCNHLLSYEKSLLREGVTIAMEVLGVIQLRTHGPRYFIHDAHIEVAFGNGINKGCLAGAVSS